MKPLTAVMGDPALRLWHDNTFANASARILLETGQVLPSGSKSLPKNFSAPTRRLMPPESGKPMVGSRGIRTGPERTRTDLADCPDLFRRTTT